MNVSALKHDLYRVTDETLDSLGELWSNPANRLSWDCPFVSPPWLKAWMDSFGDDLTPYLRAVRVRGELIGVAPLTINSADKTATFMGHTSVCDYLDFVIVPGREIEFFAGLVRDLRRRGVKYLVLESVRADSSVLTVLKGMAAQLGFRMVSEVQDVAMAVALPKTWQKYLMQLPGKHRHEIRRKLRRLYDAGPVAFIPAENLNQTDRAIETLLELFQKNRPEKAAFMTQQMAVFFRSLARALAEAGMLKLFTLQIDGVTAAAVMCFDFRSTRYLYNNAYDERFSRLSVGLMSKVLSLKDGLQSGLTTYDFLKGGEPYKRRLGGIPLQLCHCRVELD